ncbi:MAG: aspartate carbamoyltransferase regulatory subunit [Candidatus Woesearchaeota archaeon]
MKELKISAISVGTVIDHIPPQYTFKIAEILNIDKTAHVVSVANNLDSKKLGKKGLIKIGGVFLSSKDIQKIALVAPHATISKIKNYKVFEKNRVVVPDELEGIVKCFNPNCITNIEHIKTRFYVIDKINLKIFCRYCERSMTREDIELL